MGWRSPPRNVEAGSAGPTPPASEPGSFPLRVFGRHLARSWLSRPLFGAKLAPERPFRYEPAGGGAALG